MQTKAHTEQYFMLGKTMFIRSITAIVMFTTISVGAWAQSPPTNDGFSNAILITGLSPTVSGTNNNASKEAGEPNHGSNAGGKSIWYKWVAPSTSTANVTTLGSAFDTVLGVYTGNNVSSLSLKGGSDDIDTANSILSSRVFFSTAKGQTYYFAIDGFNGASGTTWLQLATHEVLFNDQFAQALPLGGITGGISSTNLGASAEPGEPAHDPSTPATASIWYKWTAPLSMNMALFSGANDQDIDGVMGVYTGNSVSSLTAEANGAVLNFDAVKGTPYFIAIDGKNNTEGRTFLSMEPTSAVANDNFTAAMAISGAMGSVTTHSVNATGEVGEPDHFGIPANSSIWFDWTAPSDGTFNFNIKGTQVLKPVFAIYTGPNLGALSEVASGNGIAGFTAVKDTVYHIAIDHKSNSVDGITKLDWVSADTPLPVLAAAVLPYARSTIVGKRVTAFMTVLNVGPVGGTNCSLFPEFPIVAGEFNYQTTDASNVAVGTPNTPVNIPAGGSQNFVFSVSLSGAFKKIERGIKAQCAEGVYSDITKGVNSFIVSSSESTPPDMLTIGLTSTGDGIVSIPGNTGSAAAAIATSQLGSDASLTLSVDDNGKGLPLVFSVCETDPVTGACLDTLTPTLTINSVNGETRTFTVIATATGAVPIDLANNRMFVRFTDTDGILRGATNFAVRTDAP